MWTAAATGSGRWSKEPGRTSERRSDRNGINNALCARAQKVDETLPLREFRNYTCTVMRECVHLRESGCPLSAGIWVSLDTFSVPVLQNGITVDTESGFFQRKYSLKPFENGFCNVVMRFFNTKEKNGLLAFRHRVTSSFSIKFTRHGGKDTKLAVDGS
jgi:hypothetical protein